MKNQPLQKHQLLQDFAKKPKQTKWRSGNIIVNYTRVSDQSQFDNTSLETQKKDAISYAEKRSLIIKALFGGVVESAKNDERKEFKKMLDFVKKDKSISAILVYSYERFSRSEHAADLSRELGKIGVKVLSVIQEVDVTSAAGRLQQNIFYAFGNYDNELRREKTTRGMIENLRNGYWVGPVPIGYTNLKRKEKAKYHEYVINDQGRILIQAFKWKAEGNLNNVEIAAKMKKMGSNIRYKHLHRILSNPFYCGYITHALIPGEIIKGKHTPLISEKLFEKANFPEIASNHKGISRKSKFRELALKRFVKEAETGNSFTGYIKKGIFYYKTRGKDSPLNMRADRLNELFSATLSEYCIDKSLSTVLEKKVLDVINEKLKDEHQDSKIIKDKLKELQVKKINLEDRFINEEIPLDLYKKYNEKYNLEEQALKQEMGNYLEISSNLEIAVKKGLKIAQNIGQVWVSSDFDNKTKIQKLVFPEGIAYDRKKNEFRTFRVNTIFSLITDVARVSAQKKIGQPLKVDRNSRLVARRGIEPLIPP